MHVCRSPSENLPAQKRAGAVFVFFYERKKDSEGKDLAQKFDWAELSEIVKKFKLESLFFHFNIKRKIIALHGTDSKRSIEFLSRIRHESQVFFFFYSILEAVFSKDIQSSG